MITDDDVSLPGSPGLCSVDTGSAILVSSCIATHTSNLLNIICHSAPLVLVSLYRRERVHLASLSPPIPREEGGGTQQVQPASAYMLQYDMYCVVQLLSATMCPV
jgi:hypothetical protein